MMISSGIPSSNVTSPIFLIFASHAFGDIVVAKDSLTEGGTYRKRLLIEEIFISRKARGSLRDWFILTCTSALCAKVYVRLVTASKTSSTAWQEVTRERS
ncbi:hypothetical protein P692DRAFT_20198238 [Suillus brevipes Sb2]|nr:hypothetical protein P692DRAFT_20198238 [Suillus brevipes Sb2]